MPISRLALGMRFFTFIFGNFNGLFKIPQQFIEQANHEMRPNGEGIVMIRKRIYHCCITERRGELFIGGQGIKQLAKDFRLVAEDVVFFEYYGFANFACCVCSGRSCMEKSFHQIRKTPINFFLEAGTYPHGLELPRRIRKFIPDEGNSVVEVQTRFGIWKIKLSNGPYLCVMGGKCWKSFCLAHNLSSVKLIQVEIHDRGKFTATIYDLDSNCEPPSMFTRKPLLLGGSKRIRCKTLNPGPLKDICGIVVSDSVNDDDSADEDCHSVDEDGDSADEDCHSADEDSDLPVNCDAKDEVPLDSWRKKIRKHMVPDFCKNSLERLYFPRDKWMAHHIDSKKVAVLKAPQYGQRTWEAKVRTYQNYGDGTIGRVALGHGWSEFADDISLIVGQWVEFQILRPPSKELDSDRMYLSLLFLD